MLTLFLFLSSSQLEKEVYLNGFINSASHVIAESEERLTLYIYIYIYITFCLMNYNFVNCISPGEELMK